MFHERDKVMQRTGKKLAILFFAGVCGASGWSGQSAFANHHHHHGHRTAVYDPPSVHYDRVYHPDYQHWTPSRGFHTHGHYDLVPHYVPGHYDTLHRHHIDVNPWYHH